MRATDLTFCLLLLMMVCVASCVSDGNAQRNESIPQGQQKHLSQIEEKEWLDYEPSTVELKGKLAMRLFYGPPNFGENPKTDSKELHRILVLDTPINVRGQTDMDRGNDRVENVQEVQLVTAKPLKEMIGKKVIVKGTLFRAHTGHHHTDVLIIVQSIDQ